MRTFKTYLKNVEKDFRSGKATEHTYRPALKSLIESYNREITATNEPKREQCGAPDFIINKKQIILGYIEAKDIGKNLDEIEKSEQLNRYLGSLNNIILTDYLEFRWYVYGEHRLTARLAKIGKNKNLVVKNENIEAVNELLSVFLKSHVIKIVNSKELANRMAGFARVIRVSIENALKYEDESGVLHQQMKSFKEVLLHGLTHKEFSDMYAQTICYGLFAARCNTSDDEHFTRQKAAWNLPKTNPFLRNLFGDIAGPNLDGRISWAVDDLADLLHLSDIDSILQDFGKRTRQEDPVVHFYETFLSAYDPQLREKRGVYYTPEPVVSYIVQSIDKLLKDEFNLPHGLADSSKIKIAFPEKDKKEIEVHKVQILDPATGTGTFLYEIINHIYNFFAENKGLWSGYVSQHLLPRLFGFELLMAPYAIAHLKLGLQLSETGYDFQSDERIRVYLTNTLEEAYEYPTVPLFSYWLAEEVKNAGIVKEDAPVMVVLGNPPYEYESRNTGEWISKLVRDYYKVDNEPLGERNPKGLQDDYVKFIRFAQWRIEQTGYGILAFISNHNYIDGPTFRGMRQNLMNTFDDIYLLDLHGNVKKKEACSNGSKDENVFDIQQGVAIGIYVKRQKRRKKAKVFHADLWGIREVFEETSTNKELIAGKYHWLWNNDLQTTEWKPIDPKAPFYLFVPQDTTLQPEYEQGWKITDIMPVNSVGIVTSRDRLAVHMTPESAKRTLKKFVSHSEEKAREEFNLGEDSRDWKIGLAQKDLKRTKLTDKYLVKIMYRPFDIRFTYYTGKSRGFHSMPRPAVMKNMLFENIALLTSRMTKGESFAHVHATRYISEKILLSPKTSNNSFHFPLYIYPSETEMKLFGGVGRIGAQIETNFDKEFIKDFSKRLKLKFVHQGIGNLKKTFGPEDIFYYIYSILHSHVYRNRFLDFLSRDFPRIPLTKNKKLFAGLRLKGEKLASLQMMEKEGPSVVKYPVPGNNKVDQISYVEPDKENGKGKVWINNEQYFEGVNPDIWQFHVGGYQVCQKWLKDRKGMYLEYDDLNHYQKIVSAISETIKIMNEIDEIIDKYGSWPIR